MRWGDMKDSPSPTTVSIVLGSTIKKIPRTCEVYFFLHYLLGRGSTFFLWKMSKDSYAFGCNYIRKRGLFLENNSFSSKRDASANEEGKSLAIFISMVL